MSMYRTLTDLILATFNSAGIQKMHDRERDVTKSKDTFIDVLTVEENNETVLFCGFAIRDSIRPDYVEAVNGVFIPISETWSYDIQVVRAFNEENDSGNFIQELVDEITNKFKDDTVIEAFHIVGFHVNPLEITSIGNVSYSGVTVTEMRATLTLTRKL